MSDEKLRELERRWKETGGVEDEAAFLLERVRTGELTQERVAYAAALGHEPALRTGFEVAKLPASWKEQAIAGAELLSRLEAVLWACEVAELALRQHWDVDDDRPARAIAAAREWVMCPCEAHAEHADARWLEAGRASESHKSPPGGEPPVLGKDGRPVTTERRRHEIAMILSANAARDAAGSIRRATCVGTAADLAWQASAAKRVKSYDCWQQILAKRLCSSGSWAST